MTTANFPDVMLPAYNASRLNSLYYIAYLMLGLYFLQNILLAVVFENYKKRLEFRVETKVESRAKMISKYFDQIDTEGKGYLTL